MSHAAVRARTGRDRTNLYQEITDKIIAELEAGRLPWVQPWLLGGPGAAGYAEKRRDPAPLFRHQRARPLESRCPAWIPGPELPHLPPARPRQRRDRVGIDHARL
jgi:hypothetical protein